MRLKMISSLCLAAMLVISGCSKGKEEKTEPSVDEPKQVETTDKEKNTYPLTGLATDNDINHRAVAVMINNHSKARPQSGLSKADIVYEMLAEGNVTRFLAVFQSEQPERVGPVRSARDYFIEIAKGLDSIYINHGYSPDAKTLLNSGYIDHLNGLFYDGTLFKRDKSRKAPHNSYISFENIEKGSKEQGFDFTTPPKEWSFYTEEESNSIVGADANKFTVDYGSNTYNVTYEYDGSEKMYKRYSDGSQIVDQDTGKEVLLDNIIVLEAPHKIIDNEGRRDIDLSNGGNAYLFQKGKMNEIQWQFVDNLFIFIKDGEKVQFVPGKTWINIVPDKKGLQSTVTEQ